MLTFALSLFLSLSVSAVKAPSCETVGPRVDGVTVVICDGSVVSYTDASGNTVRPSDWR